MQDQNLSDNFQKHFDKLLEHPHSNHIFIYQSNNYIVAKADICLFSIVGNFINIYRHKEAGNIIIQKAETQNQLFNYFVKQNFQIFCNVQFRHAFQCPLQNKNIQADQQKLYKSCACVMLEHENRFLITRRGLNLPTFRGAWVLPGGHLQKNESIIEGGLRQCQQEVGLINQIAKVNLQKGVMCWQSVFVKDQKVKSCGLVIFFNAQVSHKFQVKPHEHQVQQFKWKQLTDNQGQHRYTSEDKNGYGEAHLNYLSFFRKKNLQIEEQKWWQKNYKENH